METFQLFKSWSILYTRAPLSPRTHTYLDIFNSIINFFVASNLHHKLCRSPKPFYDRRVTVSIFVVYGYHLVERYLLMQISIMSHFAMITFFIRASFKILNNMWLPQWMAVWNHKNTRLKQTKNVFIFTARLARAYPSNKEFYFWFQFRNNNKQQAVN